MLNKVISGYFDYLQNFFNPFGIYFDTFYNPQIDDLRQAMSSYNLRNQFDFDKLSAAGISQDLLSALRTQRKDGLSYNSISYKYTPLVRHANISNNEIYYIQYKVQQDHATELNVINSNSTPRQYKELTPEQKLSLMKIFENMELDSNNRNMIKEIQDATAGTINPQIKETPVYLARVGFYGTLSLECRFATTSTSLFEDFQILFNTFFCKRDPSLFLNFQDFKDAQWVVNTKYDEISNAENLDYQKYGNLFVIDWRVELSTMFLSSYVKRLSPVNQISIFFEAYNKSF